MSKRTNIISAIETGFGDITVSNGYNTNLGNKIAVWRAVPWSKDAGLALEIRDLEREKIGEGSQGVYKVFDYLLTIELTITTGSISELRSAIDDIASYFNSYETLGGLIYNYSFVNDQVEVEQEEKKLQGGRVVYELTYREVQPEGSEKIQITYTKYLRFTAVSPSTLTVEQSGGWDDLTDPVMLDGDILIVSDGEFTSETKVFIDSYVNYEVVSTSLIKIYPNPDWGTIEITIYIR